MERREGWSNFESRLRITGMVCTIEMKWHGLKYPRLKGSGVFFLIKVKMADCL